MNYPAALDYILRFADYERLPRSAVVFDLARIEQLLERLGNPHKSAKSVHIAGTKGKGSTAAMIASILTQAGYHTGLYTSPHLLSFTERIQVDGKPIAEETFARLVETLKPEVETVNQTGDAGELTTFELLTALTFAYFKEMEVDFQVLETGLGGRLDATNVVKPEVCAITSISFDHTDVLGDTLARIAAEKAGIIKPGSITVCAPQLPEAMETIESVCREREVRLIKLDSRNWQRQAFSDGEQAFQLKGRLGTGEFKIPLTGEHQMENAATAVAVAEALKDLGARIPPESIAAGLAQVNWPGRLQILRRKPCLVVDGAHNADSAGRLARSLENYFNFERLFIIFGASSDKNIPGIVAELASLPATFIVTRSRHPRAVAPDKLIDEFSKWGITPKTTADVASAIALATGEATPEDLICATGSLFIVSEVMEYMSKPG